MTASDTSETMWDRQSVSRRSALKALGVGSVLLGTGTQQAWAAETDEPSEAAESAQSEAVTTSGAVESVTMDAEDVIAEFGSPDSADYVDLIGPNGQTETTRELKRGETAARFSVASPYKYSGEQKYDPGTYEAIAYRSPSDGEDEQVGRAEMDLQPSAGVTGFRCLRGGETRIAIENDGTGPAFVNRVSIVGDTVPAAGYGAYAEVGRPLAPGERLIAYLHPDSAHPVRSEEESQIAEYVGTTQTATFEVQVNGETVTSDLDLTYEGGPVELRFGRYSYERVAGGELA